MLLLHRRSSPIPTPSALLLHRRSSPIPATSLSSGLLPVHAHGRRPPAGLLNTRAAAAVERRRHREQEQAYKEHGAEEDGLQREVLLLGSRALTHGARCKPQQGAMGPAAEAGERVRDREEEEQAEAEVEEMEQKWEQHRLASSGRRPEQRHLASLMSTFARSSAVACGSFSPSSNFW